MKRSPAGKRFYYDVDLDLPKSEQEGVDIFEQYIARQIVNHKIPDVVSFGEREKKRKSNKCCCCLIL